MKRLLDYELYENFNDFYSRILAGKNRKTIERRMKFNGKLKFELKRGFVVTIYISDKNKKEECVKFREYWEKEWFPEIIHNLYDFCTKADGQIVNWELAESIVEDYLGGWSYAPISDTLYKESLVTVKKVGVFWRNHVIDGVVINNLEELIRFFDKKENQEKYILEDEEGNIYALNELVDRIAAES